MTTGQLVTPEGMLITVSTAGPFPPDKVDSLIRQSAHNLARIAPCTTVKVQDTYSSQCQTAAMRVGDSYTSFKATIYLKGVSSTFASQPEAQAAHEYGHAYTQWSRYMVSKGDWSPYLKARGLYGDSRLGSSYTWSVAEIAADDYRMLLGSDLALSERPKHMNISIADPRNVPGLKDWMEAWGA